jgi:protein-S-isoprenylcysteine O-methyltransferase Ste14
MFLFYLGCALLFPCWVLLCGFIPYVINMHGRVLMEESHLQRSLGSDYDTYHLKVPRYLPLGPLR